jgi:hypothetical protein
MYQKQGKGNGLKSVTSTYQIESTIISLPIDKIWEYLKSFQFEKVFPTNVKSVKFTSGGPMEVGSVFQVEFKDGSLFEKRILEISELKRRIIWEIISVTPETTYTSMVTTIKVYRVTEDNTSFLTWTTDFSNDVETNVVLSDKNLKLQNFKDLKKLK